MIDPATGQPIPGTEGMVQTMGAPAVPAAMPFGQQHFGGFSPEQRQQIHGAPPEGLLRMLQRLQGTPVWDRLMGGHAAERFGITPDNVAGMQSRQDLRQQFRQPMPIAPAPVAPAAPLAVPGMPQAVQGWPAEQVFGGQGGMGAAHSAGLGLRPRGPGLGL